MVPEGQTTVSQSIQQLVDTQRGAVSQNNARVKPVGFRRWWNRRSETSWVQFHVSLT